MMMFSCGICSSVGGGWIVSGWIVSGITIVFSRMGCTMSSVAVSVMGSASSSSLFSGGFSIGACSAGSTMFSVIVSDVFSIVVSAAFSGGLLNALGRTYDEVDRYAAKTSSIEMTPSTS